MLKYFKRVLIYFFREITGRLYSLYCSKVIIGDEFQLTRRLPVNYLESEYQYFKNEITKLFEPTTRVVIKNAILSVDEGLIIKCLHITDETLIAPEFRNHYGFSFLLKSYSTKRRLRRGNYLLVYNQWSAVYGHWLADVLPRLYFIRNELKNYKILLPSDYNTFHLDTLVAFGLDKTSIEYIAKNERYEVPNVTIISHIGTSCNTKDEVLQDLRSFYLDYYFGKNKPVPFRKLYISRANAEYRKIINDDEVDEVVKEFGFEIIYPEDYTFEEQVKLFAHCKVLMGITGSGLTNMLFMPAGGKVIEFKMKNDYHNLHYFSMSSGMQLDYYYLICEATGEDRLSANFTVHIPKLKIILDSIKSWY